MVQCLHLYVDDSGVRHPDKATNGKDFDWFGLGGVLVRDEDEVAVRDMYSQFRDQWSERLGDAPLHSHEIRHSQGPFAWLATDKKLRGQFMEGLSTLIMSAPMIGTACVIDRPGYRGRYQAVYSPAQRWSLCKTAFSVLLERAVKYAMRSNAKLRVFVERGDRKTDACMKGYYDELRSFGLPFSNSSMAVYHPLSPEDLASTLYDFKTKNKSSPLMQLADLCLYPMFRSGYDKTGRDYTSLVEHKKLIDCVLAADDVPKLGIKYSCFEKVACKVA